MTIPVCLVGLFFLFSVCFPGTAYAYLDPGTGSMLLSAVVSIVSAGYFLLRNSWHVIRSFSYRLVGKAKTYPRSDLVFYSEGAAYWTTFKPVLQALDRQGVPALYMTSDRNDPGLSHTFQHIRSSYIGSGNAAYITLNLLEADVCVMTTPGLDVLQIRRSKGVGHYAHIVHAVTDMAFYKLYSFDYYDSVLCSGPHQEKSLRSLERSRGTAPKTLMAAGCPYLDVLVERFRSESSGKPQGNCLLLAPTWGRNGLLTRFGSRLIRPLAENGFPVIIRPHPQSLKVEKALIDSLQEEFAGFANVVWDMQADGFPSLQAASVLISDLSGIVFDYAFVFERPVITVRFDPDKRGQEANDLPFQAWELDILNEIGHCIDAEKINDLPDIIRAVGNDPAFRERVRCLRSESVYHFAQSGEVAARQLLSLLPSCK